MCFHIYDGLFVYKLTIILSRVEGAREKFGHNFRFELKTIGIRGNDNPCGADKGTCINCYWLYGLPTGEKAVKSTVGQHIDHYTNRLRRRGLLKSVFYKAA